MFRERRARRAVDIREYGFMVLCMKTTFDLPDELVIAAKKRAAELRRPLRALVEEGLRAQLAATQPTQASKAKGIHWVTVDGGLPPGVDVSNRAAMHEWLRGQG